MPNDEASANPEGNEQQGEAERRRGHPRAEQVNVDAAANERARQVEQQHCRYGIGQSRNPRHYRETSARVSPGAGAPAVRS